MAQSTQQQHADGIAAIEQHIIEAAERKGMHGLRLEWNEDLDFGHLMDPVPVVVITRDGKQAEERFSIAEMADFLVQSSPQCEAKIEHIVRMLADAQPSDDIADSRGV
jgi:hypothetical protein